MKKQKKQTLTEKEITHLAKLANLHLSEKEVKKYQGQLTETIDYINNLNEINTSSVDPSCSSTDQKNVFFADGEKNQRPLSQNQALANTKKKKNDYFFVKRLL